MHSLATEPTVHEFATVTEYRASTPKTFALNETPILFARAEAKLSGAVDGPATVWVSSAGILIWQQTKGYVIALSEIVLHALSTKGIVIQGQDFELWMTTEPGLFDAISDCIETREDLSSDEEGYSIDEKDLDLESGQGDDESWEPSSHNSVEVVMADTLGKRRRT